MKATRGGELVEIVKVGDCGHPPCEWGDACVEYRFLERPIRFGMTMTQNDHISRFKFEEHDDRSAMG